MEVGRTGRETLLELMLSSPHQGAEGADFSGFLGLLWVSAVKRQRSWVSQPLKGRPPPDWTVPKKWAII